MKITNPHYRQFLDKGIIDTLDENHIQAALKNIKGKHIREGRALLITLYYTGARPAEALLLKSKHITKKGSYVIIQMTGQIKSSLPRPIHLQYKQKMIKELYQYATGRPPQMLLFYNYKGNYTRTKISKKGKIITTQETSDKLRYHFQKWFTGVLPHSIPPYFLRHNRFSKLATTGLTDRELRQLKGSRTNTSIQPYIHLSTDTSQKIAKKIK